MISHVQYEYVDYLHDSDNRFGRNMPGLPRFFRILPFYGKKETEKVGNKYNKYFRTRKHTHKQLRGRVRMHSHKLTATHTPMHALKLCISRSRTQSHAHSRTWYVHFILDGSDKAWTVACH